MRISESSIAAVRSELKVEEVVGDFISLKKRGQNLWACCPFHHENTPSFCVSPVKGFYKCFGCGAAGDAIAFVREIEGLSFLEAIQYLAQKYGITLQEENQSAAYTQQQDEKDALYILLNLAKTYYVDHLWQADAPESKGYRYIKKRGFADTLIKKFDLGYSLDTWDDFYQYAQKKGYTIDLLVKAGLIIQKETRAYDRFRGRIMFPIHNIAGKVVGFGARAMADNLGGAKYINSPETIVYQKGRLLYGIYHAKQRIRETGTCYLVEGYTDVMALHSVGIENVVGTLGTALTQEQIDLLSRFTKDVIMLFDGDQAGVRALLRGIDRLLEGGLNVRCILLPDQEDPDGYAKKVGEEAFRDYVKKHEQDFITFKAGLLLQETKDNVIKEAEAIQEMVRSIVVIPDAIKRALFLKECSKLFGIAEDVLITAQNHLRFEKDLEEERRRGLKRVPLTIRSQDARGVDALGDGIVAYEKECLRMLLNYGNITVEGGRYLYEYLLDELEDVRFQTLGCKKIFQEFKAQLAADKVVDGKYFIEWGDEEVKALVIDLLAERYEVSDEWEKRYHIYITKEVDNVVEAAFKNILRLKLRLIRRLIEDNQAAIKHNMVPAEEGELLSVHERLKRSEMEVSAQLGIVITG